MVRLARLLTGDEHRAEDLVQDALARAYALGHASPVGAWLLRRGLAGRSLICAAHAGVGQDTGRLHSVAHRGRRMWRTARSVAGQRATRVNACTAGAGRREMT
nr:sigma factor [Micromonospora sp. M71_S20]